VRSPTGKKNTKVGGKVQIQKRLKAVTVQDLVQDEGIFGKNQDILTNREKNRSGIRVPVYQNGGITNKGASWGGDGQIGGGGSRPKPNREQELPDGGGEWTGGSVLHRATIPQEKSETELFR